jgi:hypothetical protein
MTTHSSTPFQRQAIIDTHARMTERAKDRHPSLAILAGMVGDTIPKVTAVNSRFANPSPTLNANARFLEAQADLKGLRKMTLDMVNRAGLVVHTAITELEQQENTRLGFKRGNQDRAAIIAKFSTMNQADQMTQIGVWMKDKINGGAMIGIIGEADTFLTGLSAEQSARLRSDFVKSHAPDLANERDAINEQHTSVIAAYRAVELIASEVSDERRYNEIVRQKAEYDAAGAALNGSTT